MPPRKEPPLRVLLQLPELKSPVDDATRVGRPTGWSVMTRLQAIRETRELVLDAFKTAMQNPNLAMRALGTVGAALNESRKINLRFDHAPRGTPWESLDPLCRASLAWEGLGDRGRDWLDERALFLCPLLGVVTAMERIPDYRCPPGAKLPEIGSVHRFWKAAVSSTLNRLTKHENVVSFLPKRMNALWDADDTPRDVRVVRFARRDRGTLNGETAAVPRLTGEALRWLVAGGTPSMERLRDFTSSLGHRHDPSLAAEESGYPLMVFVRG